MDTAKLIAEKMATISKIKTINKVAGETRKVFHRERLPLVNRLNQINELLNN